MSFARPIRTKTTRRLILCATTFALAFAGALNYALAGFDHGEDDDERNYRGQKLTDAEKNAVQAAIDEITAMAANDHSARNRATLARIAKCLKDMLDKGRICSEHGKNNAKAATLPESPRKCTWSGDKMNVRPACLSKNEPAFSLLVAVLVHESIHTLQWPDGSGGADTSDQREAVAYAWEAYVLCRRLAEETLTGAQRRRIEGRKAFVKWQSKIRGDDSLTAEEKKKKLAECSAQKPSKSTPSKKYRQKPDESAIMQILGDTDLVEQEILTPFARTFGFDVGQDAFGGDILVVGGDNGAGFDGGVVSYHDFDGDGLADQETELFLGALDAPLSMDFFGEDSGFRPLLVILDRATQSLWTAPTDADWHPMPIIPLPFASPDQFPYLADMFSVRGGGLSLTDGASVIVSPMDDTADEVLSDIDEYVITDLDLDGQADVDRLLTRLDTLINYVPTILTDVQDGDQALEVAGMSNTFLQAFTSDESAQKLFELVGEVFVDPSNHASQVTMELFRPLVAGEFVVVVDASTNDREDQATAVAGQRPEIFGTDRAVYQPGDEVFVFGRNFDPSAVALLSDLPLPTNVISSELMSFQAPALRNEPTNMFVLEIDVVGQLSNIAGIEILPPPGPLGDMNCDGTLDGADIDLFFLALGFPDQYELLFPDCFLINADVNGDSAVDGADIDVFFECLGFGCP